MQWRGRRQSNNIEDRRGGGGMKAGGLSIGSIILALVLWKVFGVSPETTLGVTQQIGQANHQQSAPANETADQAESREFVATVLADTEDVWTPIFTKLGGTYQPPKLVMFTGSVKSACGVATSASGPFYCPADQKVYLDTQFFVDMRRHMGIGSERYGSTELSRQDQVGDFAQAYVIAHEVGHHVQTLLGISQEVRKAQMQGNERQANELSVRQELQADCFAGMWAKKNHERTGFLQQGDIEEALDAAEKIGDDYLQHKSHGHVVPDSFTHGTSAQRQRWFYRGFETGDIQACDTFGTNQL
ncbi:neutral zinc metallopeptidase [Moraxella bovis]|uniref:KPN_02809 family neutral zinc metallopeptidase n=1 Tax=Moraxella bovis TaxID=476 RepID=UPI002226D1D0|nr:neutral zinc metallopeptidase [Moraxella bovis]UYZ67452.1 neutral zinc metallopeptidase [Moraxella bovis]UYZ69812.1 neutral zinc metallopeptidase [Moraxella bovis]UYZ74267.1 neutral zinc metallopeptidase [Moraxella bovis]UYZ93916.1 neutral zinc metallopeptidase [Moraxella bovis]UZA13096.1 neutral zinc metallopeptidase [Moraxella bovis]